MEKAKAWKQINDEKCRSGKGKNNLSNSLGKSIEKVIEFLNEILKAIN
jgi:hypothetical protein